MKNSIERLHGSDRNDGRPVLTASQALGKDAGEGYFKSEWLITYAKSLRPREISQLGLIMEGMSQGLRVVGDLSLRKDRGGRTYKYPEFRRVSGQTGAKLVMEGGMVPFFNDYLDGKFIVGFTLEELIEEALND